MKCSIEVLFAPQSRAPRGTGKNPAHVIAAFAALLVAAHSAAVQQYTFSRDIGASGSGVGQVSAAYGVAFDAAGDLFVTDGGNNKVVKYSSSGAYLTQFGVGVLDQPDGVGVDPSGNVFVTDVYHNRVVDYSNSGVEVRVIGSAGTGNGHFENPSGLAVDKSGDVFVLDAGNNRVEEFSNSGVYMSQFTHGLSYPEGLALDSSGDVYVADTYNNRVVEFSKTGLSIRNRWAK